MGRLENGLLSDCSGSEMSAKSLSLVGGGGLPRLLLRLCRFGRAKLRLHLLCHLSCTVQLLNFRGRLILLQLLTHRSWSLPLVLRLLVSDGLSWRRLLRLPFGWGLHRRFLDLGLAWSS